MDNQRLVRMLVELGPEGYDEDLAAMIGRSIRRKGSIHPFRDVLDGVSPMMLSAIASAAIDPLVRSGQVPPLPWPPPLDRQQHRDRLHHENIVMSIDGSVLFGLFWMGYTIQQEINLYRPDIDPDNPEDWYGDYDYENPEVQLSVMNPFTIEAMTPYPLHNSAWSAGWIEDGVFTLISEIEYEHDGDFEFGVTIHISRNDGHPISPEEYRRIAELIWQQVEDPSEFPEEIGMYLQELQDSSRLTRRGRLQ